MTQNGPAEEQADCLAFLSLSEELHQLTLHSLFRVCSNWSCIRKLYCTPYTFPANLIVSRTIAHQAFAQLVGTDLEDDIELPVELQEPLDEPSSLNGKEMDDIVKDQLQKRIQQRAKVKAEFEKKRVGHLYPGQGDS